MRDTLLSLHLACKQFELISGYGLGERNLRHCGTNIPELYAYAELFNQPVYNSLFLRFMSPKMPPPKSLGITHVHWHRCAGLINIFKYLRPVCTSTLMCSSLRLHYIHDFATELNAHSIQSTYGCGSKVDWQVWFVPKVCKQVHDGLDCDC